MNLHLKSNKAILGIILVAHRILDGLDACSWRTEHYGMLAWLGILGIEQEAIHGMAHFVDLELDEITVYLVGTIVLVQLLGIRHRHLFQFLHVLLPEASEILGLLRIGVYLVDRESHLDMMLIGLSVETDREFHVAESRRFLRSHIDDGTSVLQLHASMLVGLEHVVAYGIFQFAITGNAILAETHLHLGILAGLIEPVGMVGHSEPKIVALIRIVLRFDVLYTTHVHRQDKREQ